MAIPRENQNKEIKILILTLPFTVLRPIYLPYIFKRFKEKYKRWLQILGTKKSGVKDVMKTILSGLESTENTGLRTK